MEPHQRRGHLRHRRRGGPPWLAHKASHEGVICVEKIAGVAEVHPLDVSNIPGCTYCTPQVASVWPDGGRGQGQGISIVKVGKFPYQGMARPSRSARRKASSRRCSMPRPASFWALTWLVPR